MSAPTILIHTLDMDRDVLCAGLMGVEMKLLHYVATHPGTSIAEKAMAAVRHATALRESVNSLVEDLEAVRKPEVVP